MAVKITFDTSGLDDVIKQMDQLGELEGEIAEKMVEAGVDIIAAKMRASAERHGLRDTGAMISSIGHPRRMSVATDGTVFSDVYPYGADKDGKSNAAKAFINEYGAPHRGIPATHFMAEALDEASAPVQSAMEAIWDKYLEERG